MPVIALVPGSRGTDTVGSSIGWVSIPVSVGNTAGWLSSPLDEVTDPAEFVSETLITPRSMKPRTSRRKVSASLEFNCVPNKIKTKYHKAQKSDVINPSGSDYSLRYPSVSIGP